MSKRLFATLALIVTSATQAQCLDVRNGKAAVLDGLPSGSGMGWYAGNYFVVGDDSPFLFKLDRKFAITGRSLLPGFSAPREVDRISKAKKPDFEAMATLSWAGVSWNLILGSGSEAGSRETGILVPTDGTAKVHVRSLSALYRRLSAMAGFKPGQLVNIEALAIAREEAYLFNRGNADRNLLFSMKLADLMAYMAGEVENVGEVRVVEAKLPRLNGIEAGFSGADYWPEKDSLVFTASVEGTDNAYNDGEVLGSFVGLIARSELKAGAALDLSRSARRLTISGKSLKSKVESIVLTRTSGTHATGAMVSDNDDGKSELFDVALEAC